MLHVQLWAVGRGSTLWRTAPGLYYRMVSEVIRRATTVHGPPTRSDFDVKLVRQLVNPLTLSLILNLVPTLTLT